MIARTQLFYASVDQTADGPKVVVLPAKARGPVSAFLRCLLKPGASVIYILPVVSETFPRLSDFCQLFAGLLGPCTRHPSIFFGTVYDKRHAKYHLDGKDMGAVFLVCGDNNIWVVYHFYDS